MESHSLRLHLMKKCILLLLLAIILPLSSAQDTITVQTLTFNSITVRRGSRQFQEGVRFRQILMYLTLMCDVLIKHDQYPCGEWDNLTYNCRERFLLRFLICREGLSDRERKKQGAWFLIFLIGRRGCI